ncbi:MAG: acetoin:2,6-dichlorophenolindophenol oxidoreductase subunit alpha, partial [Pseudonocardiales bacterium]|nr:acetoin:2,6-dichlorophenolindophenol oxidoreductase subunit alpha [Pseudonocardiales bacterium]
MTAIRTEHEYGAHPSVLPPAASTAQDGLDIAPAVRLDLYRRLEELRQFEKRAYDLFMQQLVKGTSHLSLGMEAISAGFGGAMRKDDYT